MVLCLQTKPALKTDQQVGSLELITSRTMIVFKYQVGRTMARPDKRGEQEAVSSKSATKNHTEYYGCVICGQAILNGH